MNVTPEQILAIAGLVISAVQTIKRVLPGDYDEYGPAITVLVSIVATLAWVQQYRPDALFTSQFDILLLLGSVFTAATGGYTVARQVTAVGGRQVQKLRAVRDAKRDETVPEQAA